MADFFDDLETRDPEQREAEAFAALRTQLLHAKARAPYYADALANVEPEQVTDRAGLASLPVTRKHSLPAVQSEAPPFGGLAAEALGDLARIYQSPGPIYDPEGRGADPWRTARALFAAGVRAGDVVHNTFAYHLTPAGMMVETGAHALHAAVFPAGPGNTELQVRAIADVRPTVYAGTPSFLRILLEKGNETGTDLSSLRAASVAAEALPPSLRAEIADRGIKALQWYGTADLGVIAYESEATNGLIVDEGVVVEIVRPGSEEPVEEGDTGEVVVTTFNRAYPLIRFATGDLSAVLPGGSPCGRTNMRLKGWLGRADQTVKVKGMFVHPVQIGDVLKRHPDVTRARLVVTQENGRDAMVLNCETTGADPAAIAASLQALTKLKGEVALVAPGSLPDDGTVIDDQRTFD